MATMNFFNFDGTKAAEPVSEPSGTVLVRADLIGGDRIISTENGTTTIHLGQLSNSSFNLDSTITVARAARGIAMQKKYDSPQDPKENSGNLAYITTRANS